MPLKPVLDLEVKTDAFDAFMENFKNWKKQLDDAPEKIDDVDKAAKGTAITFEKLVAAMLAQADYAAGLKDTQEEITEEVEKQNNFSKNLGKEWERVARSSRTFATNIKDATVSILKWSALTGVVTGLLGAGGLFGIERMSFAAGGWRRNALGLGVDAGEQRAFDLNFGRLVNPGQMLGGVNEAMHDVTKRGALYGAGLNESDLTGRNSAQVSVALVQALKRIADETPENMMAQVMQARRLDQFISLEDFQRLRNTPQSEIAGYAGRYARDRNSLNMTKDQLRAWQDLQVQLSRAGQTIETSFIRGLTKLAPNISKLSDAFTRLVEKMLNSNLTGDLMDQLGSGMNWLANQIDKPEFQKAVEDFGKNVVELAKGIGAGLDWLRRTASWLFLGGPAPTSASAGQPTYGYDTSRVHMENAVKHFGLFGNIGGNLGVTNPVTGFSYAPYGLSGPEVGMPPRGNARMSGNRPDRNFNPLNLGYRSDQPGVLGSDGRFGIYGNNEAGVFAAWRQLQINQKDYGLNTIAGQVNKWAPASDGNKTADYIARVAAATGYGKDQPLNFSDPTVAQRIIRAMAKEEGSNVTDAQIARGLGLSTSAQMLRTPTVNIVINNNTGGSAIVAASQVA